MDVKTIWPFGSQNNYANSDWDKHERKKNNQLELVENKKPEEWVSIPRNLKVKNVNVNKVYMKCNKNMDWRIVIGNEIAEKVILNCGDRVDLFLNKKNHKIKIVKTLNDSGYKISKGGSGLGHGIYIYLRHYKEIDNIRIANTTYEVDFYSFNNGELIIDYSKYI